VEAERTFALDVSAAVSHSRPSIDVLFESAAQVYERRLIAILLTGANSDGTAGIASVAAHGGFTIVQDPLEAESATMPQSAIARTQVNEILTLQGIAELLKSLVN
jgi:two-component system chemotaxis response regulator CheB